MNGSYGYVECWKKIRGGFRNGEFPQEISSEGTVYIKKSMLFKARIAVAQNLSLNPVILETPGRIPRELQFCLTEVKRIRTHKWREGMFIFIECRLDFHSIIFYGIKSPYIYSVILSAIIYFQKMCTLLASVKFQNAMGQRVLHIFSAFY